MKIVLITSQYHLPQLCQSYKTDEVLNSENIILWVSQNPIYTNNEKYMAFPYGISHLTANDYMNFIRSHDVNKAKNIRLLNQHSRCHDHLPDNHIRKVYDIFGKNSGNSLNYNEFLENILNSEFVISTTGDRDDCYRHYECIGLNAIPVSNINSNYKDIFDNNMVYSDAEEMVNMVHTDGEEMLSVYNPPNRDIITISYWVKKMRARINEIIASRTL